MFLLRCWKRGEDYYRSLPLSSKLDALNPQLRQFLMDLGIVKFRLYRMTKSSLEPLAADGSEIDLI